MNRLIAVLIVVAIILTFVIQPAYAEGDKVRGDESVGPAYQLGECPFTG
jgi:hypothetical protein